MYARVSECASVYECINTYVNMVVMRGVVVREEALTAAVVVLHRQSVGHLN